MIKILLAAGLVIVTVAIHVGGFSALLRVILRFHVLDTWGLHRVTFWLLAVTCWLIVIHLVEIAVWGLFYCWQDCLPDFETAFYFSGGAYTSVGFVDAVLPKSWRMLEALETLTGILMTGLSAGIVFAVVSRWISNFMRSRTR